MPPPLSTAIAGAAQQGWRADRALAALAPGLGRRTAKQLCHAGHVRINGKPATGAERIQAGDRIEYPAAGAQARQETLQKASAPRLTTAHGRHLSRLYDDASLVVLNKPAELPVHAGVGKTRRDTVEDALRAHFGGEFHFVHRLDMETSGCLLIAKNAETRDRLICQFAERRVHKEYLLFVTGQPRWERLVVLKPIRYERAEEPAGPSARALRAIKRAVALDEDSAEGLAARTEFRVLRRYRGYTLLLARPQTGRTHQIRVHAAAVGHPLAYDPLYGRRSPLRLHEFDTRAVDTQRGEQVVLNRLPLHAFRLRCVHPSTGAELKAQAPLPADLKNFMQVLKKFRAVQS